MRQSTASVTASPPAASSSAAHVGVRDAAEVVLAADVVAAGLAELVLAVGGQLERGRDRRHLVLVDRDLAARRRRAARRTSRRRRRASACRATARGSPRPTSRPSSASAGSRARRTPPSATTAAPPARSRSRITRLAAEPEPLEPPLEVEPLGRRADEQQPRARPAAAAAARTPRAAAGSACSCSGSRSSRRADRRATSAGATASLRPRRVRDRARAGPPYPAARARDST